MSPEVPIRRRPNCGVHTYLCVSGVRLPPAARSMPRARHLGADLGRVCLGVLVGMSLGYLYGPLSGTWDISFYLVAFVIGPLLALALLWSLTKRSLRRGVRMLGASIGWLLFAGLFIVGKASLFLFAFGGVFFFYLATAFVAVGFISVGLVASDWILLRVAGGPPNPGSRT